MSSSVEPVPHAGAEPSARALFFTVFPSIMLPMFLAAVDQTIVATALPAIAGSLGDVERVFGTLRADVEALFMTAPSVDLEQLHADLASMHAFVNEQVCLGSGKAPAHGRETIRRRTRSHFVRMWTEYCCWHCALFCIASFMYCTGASAACNTLTGCNRILCPHRNPWGLVQKPLQEQMWAILSN